MENISEAYLRHFILKHLKIDEATLMADEFKGCKSVDDCVERYVINHRKGKYANGDIYTNTIEGSSLKSSERYTVYTIGTQRSGFRCIFKNPVTRGINDIRRIFGLSLRDCVFRMWISCGYYHATFTLQDFLPFISQK